MLLAGHHPLSEPYKVSHACSHHMAAEAVQNFAFRSKVIRYQPVQDSPGCAILALADVLEVLHLGWAAKSERVASALQGASDSHAVYKMHFQSVERNGVTLSRCSGVSALMVERALGFAIEKEKAHEPVDPGVVKQLLGCIADNVGAFQQPPKRQRQGQGSAATPNAAAANQQKAQKALPSPVFTSPGVTAEQGRRAEAAQQSRATRAQKRDATGQSDNSKENDELGHVTALYVQKFNRMPKMSDAGNVQLLRAALVDEPPKLSRCVRATHTSRGATCLRRLRCALAGRKEERRRKKKNSRH